MVSKTCEYAIRAMIFIAQKSKNGSITGINEIADKIGSPKYFIAKVLQDLVRKELVQSLKGPTGGFYLSLIHISEPTRRTPISYAVFCLKKKKKKKLKKEKRE